jgi:hypothetical protein
LEFWPVYLSSIRVQPRLGDIDMKWKLKLNEGRSYSYSRFVLQRIKVCGVMWGRVPIYNFHLLWIRDSQTTLNLYFETSHIIFIYIPMELIQHNIPWAFLITFTVRICITHTNATTNQPHNKKFKNKKNPTIEKKCWYSVCSFATTSPPFKVKKKIKKLHKELHALCFFNGPIFPKQQKWGNWRAKLMVFFYYSD